MTELRVFTTSIMGNVPAAFYWALGILFPGGGIYFYLKNNANVNDNGNKKYDVNDNDNENKDKNHNVNANLNANYNYNACRYWGRSVARLLLVEWIILVLGIAVIFREPRAERSFCLIPFLSYFDYGTNSYFMEKAALNVLNVALFVPVGLLLGFRFQVSGFKKANVNVNDKGYRL